MKNIIVDIGNFYFKYKGDNQGSFSSKYHSNFEPNPEAFERIEIDGITTYIGVGELERTYNKADKNIIPQVLYAINKATRDNSINLCLLMPVNQLVQKHELITKFQNKLFKYKVNGQVRTTRINKCTVLPEAQVSYYSLRNPSAYQLIIDIGSRTINWCAYEDGKILKNGTEKLGTYDLFNTIMRIENSKGEDYIVEQIEGQIKRGRIEVSNDTYKDFLKDILNRIKANVNIKNHDTIFTGGGSLILEPIISKIPKISIHNNPIYFNVIGAEVICKKFMEIRFRLNPNNKKDRMIIDVLNNEYSATDTIKSLLYKMATSGLNGELTSIGGLEEYNSNGQLRASKVQSSTVDDKIADEFKDFFEEN